jgi:hypothetical protein
LPADVFCTAIAAICGLLGSVAPIAIIPLAACFLLPPFYAGFTTIFTLHKKPTKSIHQYLKTMVTGLLFAKNYRFIA